MQTGTEINLGTHGNYKALIAKGFSENQAEGIIEVMSTSEGSYATKADLRESSLRLETKIDKSRAELKEEMGELRTESRQDIARLETRIADTKAELMKFMTIQAIGIVGLTVTILKIIS